MLEGFGVKTELALADRLDQWPSRAALPHSYQTRHMRLLTMLLALLGLALPADASSRLYSWEDALHAIRDVETGGEPDHGRGAVGDGGKALGPYQIHAAYWQDAADRDPLVAAQAHSVCLRDLAYSRQVVGSYMHRYARAETARLRAGKGTLADVEKVARIHNGGPRGHRKAATLGYWNKVRALLP
jgi:hypothetical protein